MSSFGLTPGFGGGLLARRSSTGSTSVQLFLYDGNGNVTDLVDANGTTVAHYEFDPFGRIVAQSGPASTNNPWRFSTKLYDPIWGLIHYEFRVYSPEIGRWLSADPIGQRGGVNVCAFVGNDPVGKRDALGLAWKTHRNGESFATVKPSEDSDTFESLAEQLRLNYAERSRWLKHKGGGYVSQAETVRCNSEYEIPNTMIVYTTPKSGWDWMQTPIVNTLRSKAVEAGRNYQSKGYKVDYNLGRADTALFKRLWGTYGIVAFAMGGHGASWEGLAYGYVADPNKEDGVTPDQVRPPYELQAIGAYFCSSAVAIQTPGRYNRISHQVPLTWWRNLVTRGGTFVGYLGDVTWGQVWFYQVSIRVGDIPD